MDNGFFEQPILNSPYEYPARHWELDEDGQPTQQIIEKRRPAEFITPIPKPRKRKGSATQESLALDGKGLSTRDQQYDLRPIIADLRQRVDRWRLLPQSAWQVTPETALLLQHWRKFEFNNAQPFFCQIEAIETAIWLSEVAPTDRDGKRFLEHLANANNDANPELSRLALKLATGAGKNDGNGDAHRLAGDQRRPPPAEQKIHARIPDRHTRHHDQGPPARSATERSGQLLHESRARPNRHARRRAAREDRDHQLPRIQATRADGAVEGRAPLAAGTYGRGARHAGDRRADDPAGHA